MPCHVLKSGFEPYDGIAKFCKAMFGHPKLVMQGKLRREREPGTDAGKRSRDVAAGTIHDAAKIVREYSTKAEQKRYNNWNNGIES